MKCEICKEKIEETFLNKMIGTIVKDAKGKAHNVCASCQRGLGEKKKILEKL